LITKLGSVVGGVTVWLAGVAGLNPGRSEQPAHIVLVLKSLGLGIPIACLVVGSLILLRFPPNRRRHAAVRMRLARRDGMSRS
jgi:Na+/melibiose symporter-like transporter